MDDGSGTYSGWFRPAGEDDNSALAFRSALTRQSQRCDNVLWRKHLDYGPRNIAEAPGGPLLGLAVRLHDKVARLNNLLVSGKEPQFEGIVDTFVDIRNYGQIGLMVIDGEWQ